MGEAAGVKKQGVEPECQSTESLCPLSIKKCRRVSGLHHHSSSGRTESEHFLQLLSATSHIVLLSSAFLHATRHISVRALL